MLYIVLYICANDLVILILLHLPNVIKITGVHHHAWLGFLDLNKEF